MSSYTYALPIRVYPRNNRSSSGQLLVPFTLLQYNQAVKRTKHSLTIPIPYNTVDSSLLNHLSQPELCFSLFLDFFLAPETPFQSRLLNPLPTPLKQALYFLLRLLVRSNSDAFYKTTISCSAALFQEWQIINQFAPLENRGIGKCSTKCNLIEKRRDSMSGGNLRDGEDSDRQRQERRPPSKQCEVWESNGNLSSPSSRQRNGSACGDCN